MQFSLPTLPLGSVATSVNLDTTLPFEAHLNQEEQDEQQQEKSYTYDYDNDRTTYLHANQQGNNEEDNDDLASISNESDSSLTATARFHIEHARDLENNEFQVSERVNHDEKYRPIGGTAADYEGGDDGDKNYAEEEEKEENYQQQQSSVPIIRTAQSYIPSQLVAGPTKSSSSSSSSTTAASRRITTTTSKATSLYSNETFVRIGSNGVFEIRPSIVKFPGYQVSDSANNAEGAKKYSQTVSIINITNTKQRFHLLPLETPNMSGFQVKIMNNNAMKSSSKNKNAIINDNGYIAPGMSSQLLITFIPTQGWKYYSTTIKLHVLGENLIIPVEAYPVVNEKEWIFPKRIEMGAAGVGVEGMKKVSSSAGAASSKLLSSSTSSTTPGACLLGQTLTQRYEMVCTIPLQFEYSLEVLPNNNNSETAADGHEDTASEFRIFPLKGIIPANGSTWITIDYTPTRPITSSIAVKVNCSQFGFKPFVCTIVGHARTK